MLPTSGGKHRLPWGWGKHEVRQGIVEHQTLLTPPAFWQQPPKPGPGDPVWGTEEAAVDQATHSPDKPPPGLGMEGAVLADMLATLGWPQVSASRGPKEAPKADS